VTDLLVMHDIADVQLQSSDDRRLGRVTDILCRQQDDGQPGVHRAGAWRRSLPAADQFAAWPSRAQPVKGTP